MRRIIPEEDYWAIKRGGWLGPFKLSPRRDPHDHPPLPLKKGPTPAGAGLVTLLAAFQRSEHQRHSLDHGDLCGILLHDCTRPGTYPGGCAFAVRGAETIGFDSPAHNTGSKKFFISWGLLKHLAAFGYQWGNVSAPTRVGAGSSSTTFSSMIVARSAAHCSSDIG
jgi:hypothetical protein